jgi:hypothetical protein
MYHQKSLNCDLVLWLFSWRYSGRGVKLTTHLQLVLRSRMHGAIPPLPQYVFMAWCLAKYRENFIFVARLNHMISFLCVYYYANLPTSFR